jgi:isoquinoline 1-oxidoreductase beta subunit
LPSTPVDPGTVLDPDISANSIECGVAWGLSGAFKSEITFAEGRVVQSNFHDFQVTTPAIAGRRSHAERNRMPP